LLTSSVCSASEPISASNRSAAASCNPAKRQKNQHRRTRNAPTALPPFLLRLLGFLTALQN